MLSKHTQSKDFGRCANPLPSSPCWRPVPDARCRKHPPCSRPPSCRLPSSPHRETFSPTEARLVGFSMSLCRLHNHITNFSLPTEGRKVSEDVNAICKCHYSSHTEQLSHHRTRRKGCVLRAALEGRVGDLSHRPAPLSPAACSSQPQRSLPVHGKPQFCGRAKPRVGKKGTPRGLVPLGTPAVWVQSRTR